MLSQNKQESSRSTSYSYLLWLILALTTALDAILVLAVAKTHGLMSLWWIIEKSRTDPLIGFIVADLLLMRFGLFILALRAASYIKTQRLAVWLALTPIFGAPMLMAAMVANEDHWD